MAPPPPSQAGRFKPRKPARKIRVGESTGGHAQSGENCEVTTAVALAAAGGQQASTTGTGRGRGGRSGSADGRAGRGGRGSGRGARAPVQQGQAFFEATTKPVTATSRASSSARNRSGRTLSVGGRLGGRGDLSRKEVNEEIVGILEEGIGSSTQAGARPKPPPTSSLDRLEDEEVTSAAARRQRLSSSGDDLYYDDDSSADEGQSIQEVRAKSRRLLPLVLPGPGTGGDLVGDQPDTVTSQMSFSKPDTEKQTGVDAGARLALPADEWIFVQMPTRLPPLKLAPIPPESVSSGSTHPVPGSENVTVNLPSVRAEKFDHVLRQAVPGRLGRLVIYKSGRMELLLEGTDGEAKIRMNVTGHSCGFLQQAVHVDMDRQNIVMLGNAQQTLVITPELKID